jgi:hypothetical protein
MRALVFLLILLALPAAAQAAAISPSGGHKVTLTAAGDRVLATWVQRTASGGAIMARPLSDKGAPLAPARVIGTTRPGFGLIMRPAVVWSATRREFLVAFQATGPQEAAAPCAAPQPCLQADVEIYTRRVGRDGRPRGSVTRATRTGPQPDVLLTSQKPSLALDPKTGTPLLAYTAVVDSKRGDRVLRVQRLSRTGAPVGAPRRVGPLPPARGGGVSGVVGPHAGGGWLVAYDTIERAAEQFRGPTGDLFLQRLSSRATPVGKPLRLAPRYKDEAPSSMPGSGPPYPIALDVSPHPSGRALVLWERFAFSQDHGFSTRLIGGDGRPAAPAADIPSAVGWSQTSVVARGSGWIALLGRHVPGGDRDMFVVRLSAAGQVSGKLTRLTTFARQPGTQSGPNDERFVYDPAIAVSARGRVVGAWIEEPEGGAGPEVHVRALG